VSVESRAATPAVEGGPPPRRVPTRADRFRDQVLPPVLAILAALAVWWPLTFVFDPFLPTPWRVVTSFVDAFVSGDIFEHLGLSLRRVAFAWVVSTVLGAAIGIWMGRSRLMEAFLSPWVMVGLALPGPVIILFSVLLLGVEESSRLVALVVAVTPFVVNIVYEGVRAVDPGLEDMTKVYRWQRKQQVRELLLPQIAGALFAATAFAFAFAWKIVLIIEALTTSEGIGGQLSFFFKLLRPDKVVAWTLTFTVIMVLVDKFVFDRAARRIFAWRPEAEF
jgi:NitT/TauT family transport system permease protein